RLMDAIPVLKEKLPISDVILYGSYATGRYTAGSDIDLVVVYEGCVRHDAYRIVVETLNLPRLEPKVYTKGQFESLASQSVRFTETLRREGITIYRSGG
ncbi:nucleotidyltransferase domain-containing protein, partial [Candidatus Bathyarchaeota archaeon]|nr:nucleotidyltransferase domain-containing protein [Candidatus Bathyarchaeota archaeon]